MSDNRTITLPQGEFAAYQKAMEWGKNEVARLERALALAETARKAWTEIGALAQADAAQLRQTALAYVTSATYEERERLRAELYVLATVDRPGVLIVQELALLRALVGAVASYFTMRGMAHAVNYPAKAPGLVPGSTADDSRPA